MELKVSCHFIKILIQSWINNLALGWLWDGQNIERFSNIGVSLACLYCFHTNVCSQITSGGGLCYVGTSKLICEANRWTGSCVMRFLPKRCSEQTVILDLCGSGKYTTALRFRIRGGDETVSDVLGHHRVGVCFHFGTTEVK